MIIRKINIGPDLKNSMTYVVGQSVASESFIIHEILRKGDTYQVWVKNAAGEIMMWKLIENMPIVAECDLKFAS